jgi:ssDNA-binding Zn-finger/Zn-ribbon topoisomerase 1
LKRKKKREKKNKEEEKRAEIRKERKIGSKKKCGEELKKKVIKEKTATTLLSSLSDCNASLHRRR